MDQTNQGQTAKKIYYKIRYLSETGRIATYSVYANSDEEALAEFAKYHKATGDIIARLTPIKKWQ